MATRRTTIFNMPSWGGAGGGGGSPGPEGPAGPAGADGASAYEVAVAGGYTGTEQEWLATLVGPQGPEGPQGVEGPMGTQGIGIRYAGTVNTEAELPASAAQGDLYVVATPEPAHGYVWDDTTAGWVDSGPVQGPQGIQGIQGPAGPTAVSADAGNASKLGTDGLVFTPLVSTAGYLPLAGGTMTGTINVPDSINALRTASGFNLIGNNAAFAVRLNTSNLMAFGLSTNDSYKPIALPADPLQPLHAATKQYVDAKFAGGGYVLPVATGSVLGGVKVGAGLAVTADGTLSALASEYTLPIATATVLGGIKVGAPASGKFVSGVSADGTLIYATPSATGSPLRLPPTEVSTFNGVDAYLYQDSAGINTRMQLPGGKSGFRIENATGDFFLQNKLAVTQAATFSSTVNLPGTGTASSLTFGTTTYNLTVGSGGIAWRNNTTNIQLIAAASITNLVPMVTPATGNGVVFGSGGAALNRGSTSTKIAATGMIELPTTAPATGEAVPRSYVDGRVVITAVGATAPATTGLQDGAMWVEAA